MTVRARLAVAGLALGLAFGFACTGPGGPDRGPDRSDKVRALEELPPRFRSTWEAFRRDDEGWPALRAEVQADPALCAFVVDNLVREMLIAYGHADLSRLADPATRHFQRTRAELLLFPQPASEVLAELLGIGNGSAAFLAAELLGEIGRPALPAVLAQLESQKVQARQWAARLLAELPYGLEAEDSVLQGLERHLAADPDWLTRAQCAEAIGRRGKSARETRSLRVALCRALEDPDAGVREAAARGLEQLDDPDAIPALIDYLERSLRDAALREHGTAERTLRALSGARTGARAGMDPKAWRAWWREHGC